MIARTSGRSSSSSAAGIARSIAWLIALRFSGRFRMRYASSPSILVVIAFSAIARYLARYSTASRRNPPAAAFLVLGRISQFGRQLPSWVIRMSGEFGFEVLWRENSIEDGG